MQRRREEAKREEEMKLREREEARLRERETPVLEPSAGAHVCTKEKTGGDFKSGSLEYCGAYVCNTSIQ